MANFAFVRSVGTPVTATGTTVTFTVGASGAASGDLLGVYVASTTATNATGITDTGGNVYALARGVTAAGIDGEVWVSRLGFALVSTNTIVVAFSGSQAASVAVLEFSGGAGSSVDGTNAGTNTADVTPASTLTPTATNALVLGLRCHAASGTEDVTSTNYTAGANKASSIPSLYAEYSILTTAAARTLSGQWSVSGANASVNVAMFNIVPVPTVAYARAAMTVRNNRRILL